MSVTATATDTDTDTATADFKSRLLGGIPNKMSILFCVSSLAECKEPFALAGLFLLSPSVGIVYSSVSLFFALGCLIKHIKDFKKDQDLKSFDYWAALVMMLAYIAQSACYLAAVLAASTVTGLACFAAQFLYDTVKWVKHCCQEKWKALGGGALYIAIAATGILLVAQPWVSIALLLVSASILAVAQCYNLKKFYNPGNAEYIPLNSDAAEHPKKDQFENNLLAGNFVLSTTMLVSAVAFAAIGLTGWGVLGVALLSIVRCRNEFVEARYNKREKGESLGGPVNIGSRGGGSQRGSQYSSATLFGESFLAEALGSDEGLVLI